MSPPSAERRFSAGGDGSSQQAISRVMRGLLSRQGRPAALVTAVLLALLYAWLGGPYWQPVRNAVFDTYQRLFPRPDNTFHVVIVDIDDDSLATFGRWPWPRTRLARLIEMINQFKPKAIGLDIIMSEADSLSPDVLLAERPDLDPALRTSLSRLPSNDAILAQVLRQAPVVVGRAGGEEVLVDSVGAEHTGPDFQTTVMIRGANPIAHIRKHYSGHTINVPLIRNAASGHGYLDPIYDLDKVVRAMPLIVVVNGKLAPSLALELLRVASQEPFYTVYGHPQGVRGVEVGNWAVPTEPDGSIRLYYARPKSQQRVSAHSVLQGAIDSGSKVSKTIKDKLVIIGITGLGLIDKVATPVDPIMDGVEVHAQFIENIMTGMRLVRPPWAHGIELLVFLLTAGSLILYLPRLRPGYGLAVFFLVGLVLAGGGILGFIGAKWLLDPSFPILGNALTVVVLTTIGFREVKLELEAEKETHLRIAGELKAAHEIQMGILPAPDAIVGLPDSIEFYAKLEPAEEVGGDLYDAFMIDEDHFFFLIGDVSGKGVPASLFMALSKTLCKSAALRERVPVQRLMSLVNEEISRENPALLFVTAVVGIINVRTGHMDVCNAGHDAPILLRPDAPPSKLVSDGGPPLCVLEDFPYNSTQVQLQAHDTLLLITDGVTEAHNKAQELYGMERTMAYCASVYAEGAEPPSVAAICQDLYHNVQNFAKGTSPSDDIAIVGIRFVPSPGTPLPSVSR
jgi:adenylate cyclase